MFFMADFLALITPADQMLQSRETDYREAIPVLQSTMKSIVKLRADERFVIYMEKTDDLLKKVNEAISSSFPQSQYQPRPIRDGRRSSALRDFAVMDTIGERALNANGHIKACYFEVIDVTVAEFNDRFMKHSDLLIALSSIDEMSSATLEPLKELGIVIPNDAELMLAKENMDMKRNAIKKHNDEIDAKIEAGGKEKDLKSQKKKFSLLSELYAMRSAFKKTCNLVAAVDCFACSTAVCEASFSALSRVGIMNRISMTNIRLRHLSYLAFE